MPPFHPTAREIVLLTVLFTSLLFFSATFPRNSGSVTDILKTLPYVVEEELDTAPLTLETQYTLQALNRPLSWGAGQVPETKIVAHVPGELFVLYCALSLLFRSRILARLRRGPCRVQRPLLAFVGQSDCVVYCLYVYCSCLSRRLRPDAARYVHLSYLMPWPLKARRASASQVSRNARHERSMSLPV